MLKKECYKILCYCVIKYWQLSKEIMKNTCSKAQQYGGERTLLFKKKVIMYSELLPFSVRLDLDRMEHIK